MKVQATPLRACTLINRHKYLPIAFLEIPQNQPKILELNITLVLTFQKISTFPLHSLQNAQIN